METSLQNYYQTEMYHLELQELHQKAEQSHLQMNLYSSLQQLEEQIPEKL